MSGWPQITHPLLSRGGRTQRTLHLSGWGGSGEAARPLLCTGGKPSQPHPQHNRHLPRSLASAANSNGVLGLTSARESFRLAMQASSFVS